MTDTKTAVASELGKRVEEVRTERRRRVDITSEGRGPLGVNEALLDPSKFTYRWINDSGGRIEALTKRDDWDIMRDPSIKDENESHNEGAQVRHQVGTNMDGSPLYAYLCRKPIEFHIADRAKKQVRSNELEAQIMSGKLKGPNTLSTDNPTAYIPGGSNSIVGPKGTLTYKP